MRPHHPPMKTYSHLAGTGRLPSDYELLTSRLLYYFEKGGFETNVPVRAWYERHQRGSALSHPDWEQFRDPRETTYTKYVALAAEQETHLDALLRSIEESDYDARLPSAWLQTLERTLPPLRFPVHGLQMLSAYVGQMAPSGRITVAALLQTGDEIRRVHRLAYRIGLLRRTHPRFGEAARGAWERDDAWQPLRRALETALCAYDWGECFVALNLCLKPALDLYLGAELPRAAVAQGDYLLAPLLESLGQDAAWQRSWTAALVRMLQPHGENRRAIESWTGRWLPPAIAAIRALQPVVGASAEDAVGGLRAHLQALELAV